jgi:hypothetical protein
MNTDLNLSSTRLQRGELQRINDGEGKRVLNLQGTLWLTQQGDARDVVLEAGDMARIEHDGLSIVSALSDARFVLLHDDDAPSQWDWRIRAAQAALAAY